MIAEPSKLKRKGAIIAANTLKCINSIWDKAYTENKPIPEIDDKSEWDDILMFGEE